MKKIFITLFTFIILISINKTHSFTIGKGLKQTAYRMKYCGMVNENVFSISSDYRESVNLYYNKNTKQINWYGNKLKVKKVTPSYLLLERFKIK